MESRIIKVPSPSGRIMLKVIPGHFATTHSHTNYYVDVSTLKTRHSDAYAIASELAGEIVMNNIVDTILCLDGSEVVGAYLADCLCRSGVQVMNRHSSIYVISPEYSGGQLVIRDNYLPMIRNKNVLLLNATVSTGISCVKSAEAIEYYGGHIRTQAAIFSALEESNGLPIHAIFTPKDLPDYQTFAPHQCPLCREGRHLDALVNGFGYSKL